jgi:Uma2 family endonuclease
MRLVAGLGIVRFETMNRTEEVRRSGSLLDASWECARIEDEPDTSWGDEPSGGNMPDRGNNAGGGLLTLEEYSGLPEDHAYRHELIRGMLVREPRPGVHHGVQAVELAAVLHGFVRRHGIGRVMIETGFILAEDPVTLRGPDIAFVSEHRLRGGIPQGFFRGAPDLAVEIVSRSNSRAEIRARVEDYLTAGSRLVWIVDSIRETVAVHRVGKSVEHLHPEDDLPGGDVLPGFRVRVGDLFIG